VERTAYRVVQEALTNVHKHAGAVRAVVELRYTPDTLEVVVDNSPPAPERVSAMPTSGFGLVGLSERVHLIGGELTTRARPDGGFTVHAILPAGVPVDAPVGEPS
jgi:signal transduction histidine kinase